MTPASDWHDKPSGGGCEATCTANLAKLILPANATWMGAARCEADAPVNDCPIYNGGGGDNEPFGIDTNGDGHGDYPSSWEASREGHGWQDQRPVSNCNDCW